MFKELGQYKSLYPKKNLYESNNFQNDSPIKIYEAGTNNETTTILKVIDKTALKEEEDEDEYNFHIEQIKKEIKISYLCNSDYTNKIIKDFETEQYIALEEENYDSDLNEYIFNGDSFNKKLIGKNNELVFKNIIIDLSKALKFINSKNVVHRNIKPHNIYITESDEGKLITKLGNFSSAIFINEIKNSKPMGAIYYTAPEIIKNLDYNEKCDMWSLGITLFELYFEVLPYGWHPNIDKINEMLLGQNEFIYGKSGIPSLDVLFNRLLQINPDERMSISEFYDYVNDKNFMNGNLIPKNNYNQNYTELYEQIKKQKQVSYPPRKKKEKFNSEESDKQNYEKIIDIVEEGYFPDIMSFPNEAIKKVDLFNNIIYYDTNIAKHKTIIYKDSKIFEKNTPGAFIFCYNLDSLKIIKDEILKNKINEKEIIFNMICNARGYVSQIKKFLEENNDFRICINKLCLYCKKPSEYKEYKEKNPEFIHSITNERNKVLDFIKDTSSKKIKPFPLTKLITLDDYLETYKERHKKISEFYGNLTLESYKKNMEKIKDVINEEDKENLLKTKNSNNLLNGLMKFDLTKDLEAIDELIIKEYTTNTFYGDLNRWLMKGKMKYYEPIAYFTSRLMYSLNSYAEKNKKYCKENKKILYRGAKLYFSCLLPYIRAVGKIILLSAFTSTSSEEKIAENWAGRGKERKIYDDYNRFSVVFKIINLFNDEKKWISNSIDVQEESKYKKEKEFLFQPFSFYKVIDVKFDINNFKADITLETVGKKEILEERLKFGKEIKYNMNENIMEII